MLEQEDEKKEETQGKRDMLQEELEVEWRGQEEEEEEFEVESLGEEEEEEEETEELEVEWIRGEFDDEWMEAWGEEVEEEERRRNRRKRKRRREEEKEKEEESDVLEEREGDEPCVAAWKEQRRLERRWIDEGLKTPTAKETYILIIMPQV